MNHSKLYISLGTIILSITGLVAIKAHSKFGSYTHACFSTIPTGTLTIPSANARLTSIKGSGTVTLGVATRANPFAATIFHTAVTCVGRMTQLFLK